MSGRSVQIAITAESSLLKVKLQAQDALQVGRGVLRNLQGQVLDMRQAVGEAGLKPRDTVTLHLRQTAAVGGVNDAFAAIMGDGCVVTWGNLSRGGDSSLVREQLIYVEHVRAARWAFAAILEDGSVVTWGDPNRGGDSSDVQQLKNVQHIQATSRAFAALLEDKSVVAWGTPNMAVTAVLCNSSSRTCSSFNLLAEHLLLFCTMDRWSLGEVRILVVTAVLFRSNSEACSASEPMLMHLLLCWMMDS